MYVERDADTVTVLYAQANGQLQQATWGDALKAVAAATANLGPNEFKAIAGEARNTSAHRYWWLHCCRALLPVYCVCIALKLHARCIVAPCVSVLMTFWRVCCCACRQAC